MTDLSHIRHGGLADKVMSAEEAAAQIEPGSNDRDERVHRCRLP